MKNIKHIIKLSAVAVLVSMPLFAKEPTNIMIGVGVGAGQSKISIEHSQIINDPIYGTGNNSTTLRWNPQYDTSLDSWALAWEFLIGYKHFVNDYVGFRYYANVGIQHYKPSLFESKTQPIGFIDYTLNADLLIDFYESEAWAVGMLGGLGFGGTSFDKEAINKYMAVYDRNSGRPIEMADINKHFFNVNASVGLRAVVFQKVRRTGARVCDRYVKGKRICRVPVFYIGHNFEINAKFPLLDYYATPYPDIIDLGNNNIVSRPGYKVKNPYRVTVRYIVDF